MAQYGTTSEQLAQVAVAARSWALLNPAAPYPTPLTVDDVLSSAPIAGPLHKLDCCLITDGGAAALNLCCDGAGLGQAARLPTRYRRSLESPQHLPDAGPPTTEATRSAERAMRMAVFTHADIDTAHIYDAFTISLMILLEDLGFCPKGDGGPYVADGNIAPKSSLALNSNGGGLSYTHPGMHGLFLITEAVRQLRGDSGARQKPAAAVPLVHGMGLTLAAHATAVLGTST